MKRTKLWSVLLAVLILCVCALGILYTGAGAEGANKLVYAAGDLTAEELGVDGATYFTDIMGALSDLEKNSRQHPSDAVAEIHFKGSLTGGDQGNLLFAQTTIWREDGTKLPISIIGHDTTNPQDAYIYLDGIGGWYTCANDYTFVNLTLPVGDQETYFYAGSGNVRLDNVTLVSNSGATIKTVADRTNQYLNAKAAALSVCEDVAGIITPDVGRLPAGDAWQKVRTSAEYMATGTVKVDADGVEYVDKDLNGADGSLYGDYSHAGNTGGGQYLNACVYYEAILGLDCRDNDWTPADYALDPDLQKILQEAAHEAVLEVYGEDHFKNPVAYERQGDGVVNLLMMGSSSSFYMRDELHLMAEHIGIKFRVVHAYSSGIKMSTQWSWTEKENGKWGVYTVWDGKTTEKKDQKMTDFVALYDWDAIVTYETGGSFSPAKLGYGYSDATREKAVATCDKADEFINYVYNYNANNANARYFWFQTVGAPVGAPGPSEGAKGYLFADNNTSAAYAGWTQADLERYSEDGKVVSSLILGESMSFGTRVNAVGYLLTAPETPYTDETAAQVEFVHLDGFETDLDVRPVDTLAKLVIDADTAAVDMTPIKRGYSPASAELHIKKGSGGAIQAYGYSANGSGVTRYGDVTVRWTGGLVGQFDLLYGNHLTGDLKLIIDPPEGTTLSTGMIRMSFSSPKITGDVSFYAKNCTMTSFYGGGGQDNTVTNTLTNCTVTGDFFGTRTGSPSRVYNTVTNCTIGGMYAGGHWDGNGTTTGPIVNTIDGLDITGAYYGGANTGGSEYTAKVTSGDVEIDGKTESLAIYNDIKALNAVSTYFGGSRGGTCGNVRNDIDGLAAATYYGAGGGSGTTGKVFNNVKNATVTGSFYGGSSSKSTNATKNITTDIQNITLGGDFYGGNLKSVVNGTITTTVRGGTFNGSYYGGNDDSVVKNLKKTVNNIIYGGSFNGDFHGGSVDGDVANITNTVYGGTFATRYSGAGYKGSVSGNVTNNIYGGTFVYLNGGFSGTVDGTVTVAGDILNTVKGPVVIGKTFAGATVDSGGKRIPKVGGTIVNVFDVNEKGEAPDVGDPVLDGTAFGYYGSGHHVQAGQGVVNHIKAGTFRKLWMGGGQYQGYVEEDTSFVADAYTPEGVEKGKYCFINIFEGGTFEATKDNRNYVWGGTIGFNSNYTHGDMLGGVYSEVSGDPVFDMRFIGGHRGYKTSENQPITVKISGGTFNKNVFMLASQLGDGLSGTIHTGNGTITGGTFNKAVYGGSNGAGSATNCTLTVQGGTFNGDLIASSYPISGTTISGSFTLTLEPTAGDIVLKKAVSAQNDAETVVLKGGDQVIKIDADSGIYAASYDGTAVTFEQTEGFAAGTTYVKVPTASATENITVTKTAGKTGYAKKAVGETETEWIGFDAASVYGVNLILEQKIGLRAWLNQAEIDAIGEAFTYVITCDDKTLASGTYADLLASAEIRSENGISYYTLKMSGLEPASFHKTITFGGTGMTEAAASINDVLQIVIRDEQSVFSDGFETLAKSLWNYGIEAYNRFSGETSTLAKEELSAPADAQILASAADGEVADAKLAGRALVLREAVGVRLYLNLQNGVKAEDLTFTLNGTALSEELLNIREESGNGYNASVTLYVAAAAMDKPLEISVTKGESFVGSYTDSVASICQQYRDANAADAALCTAILRYVQAVPGMND